MGNTVVKDKHYCTFYFTS